MAARVGWLLSALAVLITGVFSLISYVEHRGVDVGELDVAGDMGLGWVGVWMYWLAPALALIWGPVLVVVLVKDIAAGIKDARRP